MTSYTTKDLLAKIEWEGGVLDAILYGIKSDQVPAEVEDLWADLQEIAAEVEQLEAAVMAILESSLDEDQARKEEWEDEFDPEAD